MGFVPEAALIALREGLEAFLITGLLLGLVTKLGRPDARRWIWGGFGLGVAASLALGLVVHFLILEPFEQQGGGAWFELVAALAAVAVLTYMVFWMWNHTRTLMTTVRQRVEEALGRDTLWVVAALTFFSVVREGLEVVLFYGALSSRATLGDLALSGLAGAAVSAGLVLLLFRSTVRLNLRRFFAVTGLLLVFIAGGLLVHAVHAATDLGLLEPAPALWDTSAAVPDDRADGRILHALVGYTAAPTLFQALLYFGYVFGVGITYLASLGAFRERPTRRLRRVPAAAVALLVLVAATATAWGAANPLAPRDHDDAHALEADPHGAHGGPLGEAAAILESLDARVGLLVRDHGEIVRYNATTYESIKHFIRSIWPYTGLPPELLLVDEGTYYLDEAHPYDEAIHPDPRLVDAWLEPRDLPAAPVADPVGLGLLAAARLDGAYYFAPGPGPGWGEGDLFEIYGLGAYRDWLKMDNHSPRHEQGLPVWRYAENHLAAHFGDRLVVAFAHGHDPKVDPDHTLDAAAMRLAGADLDVVFDLYQSSIHSDAMNTCMMRPHAEHALRAAGYAGPILPVGMPGLDPLWGHAVAARLEDVMAGIPGQAPLSVHLTQHGARPGSPNPCGDGADQYHANAAHQYEATAATLRHRFGDDVVLRHVYGLGAAAPDDGVLSPTEALDLDRRDGVARVVILPYEFWGDGVDVLVYLREALGFEPHQAPYYDAEYETRFMHQGLDVRVLSGDFSPHGKADALLSQVAVATQAWAAEASAEAGSFDRVKNNV